MTTCIKVTEFLNYKYYSWHQAESSKCYL